MAAPTSTDRASAIFRESRIKKATLARMDAGLFARFVIRDERSGKGISLAPMHKSWHQLANEHDRLLIWAHVESGKTTEMAVGRTLYAIGKDPTTRVAIVSNTHGQAEKIVRTIARYLESSAELKMAFPVLERAEPWTSSQLFVKRPTFSKDPTVQAFGVHGNVTGARLDLLILDDVLDYENCRTPHARQDLVDWYHATLAGRLTQGARVICIGTAYHPDDLLHRFARSSGWSAFRYPVLNDDGSSRWPEAWSPERVEKKRAELGPVEFARQMLCVAREDSEARFKREWVEKAIKAGDGKMLCDALAVVPSGYKTYTGVDLAVQRHSSADWTALFTIIVHPDGKREVLNCERGKWSGPEIVQRIFQAHERYHSICVVENNAAQDFLLQWAAASGAGFIRPFTTGRNKANPEFGVESLATEMAVGKWIIPSHQGRVPPALEPWLSEMLYYDPQSHTGDCLMASWFAREGVRLGDVRVERGRLDLTSR